MLALATAVHASAFKHKLSNPALELPNATLASSSALRKDVHPVASSELAARKAHALLLEAGTAINRENLAAAERARERAGFEAAV